METIRSLNIFPSDECLPIKLWFINRSTHFPQISPRNFPNKYSFAIYSFIVVNIRLSVSRIRFIFFSFCLILHPTIYRFLERKVWKDTMFPRAIFKLYPSILCLEEKRFRLQAETVSGRLPRRLSRAGCIIHVFQAWIYMGIVPATLVYIAVDLQSRLLAAFPFIAEHRWLVADFSRQFFFLSEKNEVCWNSWKRRNEYRIMNRWNVIPDGIIGQRRI